MISSFDYIDKLIELEDKKINNIKIGTKNYAHSCSYWKSKDETTVTVANNLDYVTITKIADVPVKHVYLPFTQKLEPGQYTVSFDIKTTLSDSSITETKIRNGFYNSEDNIDIGITSGKSDIINEVIPTNEWIHKEKTLTITETDIDSLFFTSTDMEMNQTIDIKNVKVEKGNKATDYQPAYEEFALKSDLDSFINNLTTKQLTALKAKLDSLP